MVVRTAFVLAHGAVRSFLQSYDMRSASHVKIFTISLLAKCFASCRIGNMGDKTKKNPSAVALGRLGGLQTAKQFTKKSGRELAKKRWGKAKVKKGGSRGR
jgi:hypothetical protein